MTEPEPLIRRATAECGCGAKFKAQTNRPIDALKAFWAGHPCDSHAAVAMRAASRPADTDTEDES